MEGKNIPPLITLSAAMVACIICILRHAPLYNTLRIVLVVMIIFFIIGCIVRRIVVKINADAEEMALQRQREEQELAAAELATPEEAPAEQEKPEEQQENDTAGREEA